MVRHVGPAGADLLAKLGISTVEDLLCHIPRRYEDRSTYRPIAELRDREAVLVRGRVIAAENVITSRRGMRVTRAIIRDGSGAAELVFFNQPYLLRRFQELARQDRQIVVYGTVRHTGFGIPTIEHPEWEEEQPASDPLSAGRIVPVYNLSEGLTQGRLRRIMAAALETHVRLVEEKLPSDLRARYGLMGLEEALRNVHFPASLAQATEARRRLVFEEFLVLQLALALQRGEWRKDATPHVVEIPSDFFDTGLASLFPFELTDWQRQAIREIATDMASGQPMNRLLHGDVGSGKTAVAVAAIVLAVRSGLQAAFMAPTEVLAHQHAAVLREWLVPQGIDVRLAVGGMSASARGQLRQELASGAIHVVVGTHALIEEDVVFARLGLVIVDEQHRFGVLQRKALLAKGFLRHVLVMSATPIPRTLTLTLYGDLDVTCLKGLPPGRHPVRTYWKRPEQAPKVYDGVRQLLERGRQAYVVCPLVDASDKLEAAAATEMAERIRKEVLPGFRIGLLHGQMPAAEKSAVMNAFKAHELDVLVSTTVIEVGVDVPNAAVMVVENADRFGLAQLHQLRGRVGRGGHASYCVLIADPKTEEGQRRLQIMTETNDGFKIAEEDLCLRGPGEFYGTRQSGIPTFRFGDILQDEETLILSREAARAILEDDPSLAGHRYRKLREAAEAKRRSLELLTAC